MQEHVQLLRCRSFKRKPSNAGSFVPIFQERKQNKREIDFIAERQGEKIYFQVALRISEKQTMEREFGNLMAIKDNYPKYVITLDEYSGISYKGILHLPLRQFLSGFV